MDKACSLGACDPNKGMESTVVRKRSLETLLNADYAQYGVIHGEMHTLNGAPISCGVICIDWPSWAFGLQARGWRVKFILLKDNSWSKALEAWFPDTHIIDKDDQKAGGTNHEVNAWFSEVDPPRKLRIWESTAYLVVSTKRVRHIPNSWWRMSPSTLHHVDCGGVSDGSWTFYIYTRTSSPVSLLTPAAGPQRDLTSVMDTLISGTPVQPPPLCQSPMRPVVVQLRPNTYSCSGLFPWNSRKAFVITRSVFSPTKWVKRKLLGSEVLKVLDLPETLVSELSSAQRASLCQLLSLVPSKVILCLLDSLPNWAVEKAVKRLRPLPPVEPLVQHVAEISSRSEADPQVPPPPPALVFSLTTPVTASSDGPADPLAMEAIRNRSATKSDDALVPEYLWDRHIVSDVDPQRLLKLKALVVFRRFFLLLWQRRLTSEFYRWFRSAHGSHLCSIAAKRDLHAGAECLSRCWGATWWEWVAGSRPFFWRWPLSYRTHIRDGIPLWTKGPLPTWRVAQRANPDPVVGANECKKLVKIRRTGYVIAGLVKSLTSFFSVPKGLDDIRMVYDGTKCGLSAVLWSP